MQEGTTKNIDAPGTRRPTMDDLASYVRCVSYLPLEDEYEFEGHQDT